MDEHIEPWKGTGYLCREPADVGLARQVGDERMDLRKPRIDESRLTARSKARFPLARNEDASVSDVGARRPPVA
jgi:hypothetical protein